MSDVLSVRFDTGTKARLERVRLALVKQTGVKITRAAVIKMLLEEGFKVVEGRIGR
jgi:transposase